MGESGSSVLHRVVRAGQNAFTTAGSGGPETATAEWPTTGSGDPKEVPASATAATRIGTAEPLGPAPILGRYRLHRRLGAGGFGTVWLARDERLEREVAVKMLPRERIASGRFEREARVAARLNHPGIVTLYEAAVDDEGGYLVSELVRGRTFGHLVRDGCLSDRDIVGAGVALCDALDYAHRHGVVHRDVKPSNVLVPDAPSTAAEVAKLTDFGVARVLGGDALTLTGDVVGTTAYMAPEQAAGREVDASADLYSLALVLYEALTGINPLRSGRPGNGGPARPARPSGLGIYLPAVRRHRRDLPRELGCAIDLALRPRPRERGTVGELRSALICSIDQVKDDPGVVEPSWPSRRTPTDSSEELRPVFSPPPPRAPRHVEQEPWQGTASWAAGDIRGERAKAAPGAPEHVVVEHLTGISPASRLTAGIAAAVATAWFAATVLSPAPLLPALAVVAAGTAVALLPRVGWLMLICAGALLLVEQNTPGGAVLLLVAAVPPVVLLLRRPARWPLPALVPGLAVVGLAGAWPALAGRAATAWQRFVLGAAGWVWLVIGGFLDGSQTYLRVAPGVATPPLWIPSPSDALHQVLHPLVASGLLAPAVVWGGAAVVLPSLTVGPGAVSPGSRVIRVLAWAVGVVVLTYATLALLAPGVTLRSSPVLVGALACAAVAMLPGITRRGRAAGRWSDAGAGLA